MKDEIIELSKEQLKRVVTEVEKERQDELIQQAKVVYRELINKKQWLENKIKSDNEQLQDVINELKVFDVKEKDNKEEKEVKNLSKFQIVKEEIAKLNTFKKKILKILEYYPDGIDKKLVSRLTGASEERASARMSMMKYEKQIDGSVGTRPTIYYPKGGQTKELLKNSSGKYSNW